MTLVESFLLPANDDESLRYEAENQLGTFLDGKPDEGEINARVSIVSLCTFMIMSFAAMTVALTVHEENSASDRKHVLGGEKKALKLNSRNERIFSRQQISHFMCWQ